MKKNQSKRNVAVESLESRTLLSNVWYVAVDGNDGGAGDANSPFASIQHAVNVASEGDKIKLRSGVYNETVRIDKPGLTIRTDANQPALAQITSPNNDPGVEVTVRIGEDAHNTKLAHLDISGGYYYAVKTESLWDTGAPSEHAASGVKIKHSRLHDSGADVIKLTPGTNYSEIIGNEIFNSGRTNPDNAEGIDAVQANFAVVRGNYVHDITTNGIYYKGGSRETLIENNTVTRTGHSGILLGQHSDENWFDMAVNPDYFESIDSIVRNNVVYDTEGAGIGAWAALRPQIYNNTLDNVAKSMFGGLLVQGQEHWVPGGADFVPIIVPSQDVSMFNNVVNVYSERPVLEVREAGLVGYLNLANNLYFQGEGRAPQVWDVTTGYYGNLNGWKRLGFDANSLQGSALLNPSANYSLSPGSPAIDRGVDVGLGTDINFGARPLGGAVDIGAHEFA